MFSHRYKKTCHEPRIKGTFNVKERQKGHGQKLQVAPAPTSPPERSRKSAKSKWRLGGLLLMWDGRVSSFMSNKTRSFSLLFASPICFAVSKSLLFGCLTFCLSSLAMKPPPRRSAPARCTTATTGHRHRHDDGHHDLLVLSVFFVFIITVSFSELRIKPWKKGNPQLISPDLSQYGDLWFVNKDMDCIQYPPTRAGGGLHLSYRNLGFEFWRFQVPATTFSLSRVPNRQGDPKLECSEGSHEDAEGPIGLNLSKSNTCGEIVVVFHPLQEPALWAWKHSSL